MQVAEEYFEHCEDNPWVVKDQDVPRPFTIDAFCTFAGIDEDTFDNYGTKAEYQDFFGVVRAIRRMIRSQKFEGAAVGVFNSNIIARDLGLTEKINQTATHSITWEVTKNYPSND